MKKSREIVMMYAYIKDLSSVMLNDYQGFITDFCELLSSQYDEYVESLSFTAEED